MEEALGTLGIDPLKLGAQIINFTILVFLINQFALKPILKLLKERQETLIKTEKLSQELEELKEKTLKEKAEVLKKAEIDAAFIINEAKKEAEKIKKELIEKTERELLLKEQEFTTHLHEKKQQMIEELNLKLAEIISLAVEKTLNSKPELNEKVIAYYLTKIK